MLFRAGLPVPQPLPAAPHAPAGPTGAAVLVPHPPAEGDAPEPELPPHAVPPPVGEVPQPPPPPPLPPPALPGVPAAPPHPAGLASCPHPVALGAACAGNVPLAGGSCVPLSPARASSSGGSDLSPRTRFASFVCSSVRPYGFVL